MAVHRSDDIAASRDPVLLGEVLADTADLIARAAGERAVARHRAKSGGGRLRTAPQQAAALRAAASLPAEGTTVRGVRRPAPRPGAGAGAVGEPERGGRPGACAACGRPAAWYPTAQGGWLMIEPGRWPAASVPRGSRWRITAGRAARVDGEAAVSGLCRVRHDEVCPSAPAPASSSFLAVLWRRNTEAGG